MTNPELNALQNAGSKSAKTARLEQRQVLQFAPRHSLCALLFSDFSLFKSAFARDPTRLDSLCAYSSALQCNRSGGVLNHSRTSSFATILNENLSKKAECTSYMSNFCENFHSIAAKNGRSTIEAELLRSNVLNDPPLYYRSSCNSSKICWANFLLTPGTLAISAMLAVNNPRIPPNICNNFCRRFGPIPEIFSKDECLRFFAN